MNKRALGRRLRIARKAAGLSQGEVANQLGLTQQAVSNWETGQQPPQRENLQAAAMLYGVSIDWLLTGDGEDDGSTEAKTFDVDAFERWARGRFEDTIREIKEEYARRVVRKRPRLAELNSNGQSSLNVERFAAQGGLQRDPQAILPGSHEDLHLRAAAERARRRVLDEEGHDSGRS